MFTWWKACSVRRKTKGASFQADNLTRNDRRATARPPAERLLASRDEAAVNECHCAVAKACIERPCVIRLGHPSCHIRRGRHLLPKLLPRAEIWNEEIAVEVVVPRAEARDFPEHRMRRVERQNLVQEHTGRAQPYEFRGPAAENVAGNTSPGHCREERENEKVIEGERKVAKTGRHAKEVTPPQDPSRQLKRQEAAGEVNES